MSVTLGKRDFVLKDSIMASKKAAAGVDNTQRRKWDKDEYAERAREREREEEEEEEERLAPKSKPRPPCSSQKIKRFSLCRVSIIPADMKGRLKALESSWRRG